MLDQVQSLIDSIDSYKDLSARGEKNGQEVRELILESIDKIWRILGHNGVSIGMIMDTLEKSDTLPDGEYRHRMNLLNESVVRGTRIKEGTKPGDIEKITRQAKLDFIRGILSFFGLPNVDLFIARGTIQAIEKPIVYTKIRASILLREEKKEGKKNRAPKGLNLEGIAPLISVYQVTHSSLLDRQSAIRNIINDELIAPLAEEGPFKETKRYREAVALYIKREGKTEEITRAERRIQHLEILASGKSGKGLNAMLKRARMRLGTELKKYRSMTEAREKSETPIEISDIVHDVVSKFGVVSSHRKIPLSSKDSPFVTSERIIAKLKRAMAIVVHHKFPELKQLRTNQGEIQKMIQRFEEILKKYQALLNENKDGEGQKAIIIDMKMELDEWEERSNGLLEEYSIRNIRMLRNAVIESLTSTI